MSQEEMVKQIVREVLDRLGRGVKEMNEAKTPQLSGRVIHCNYSNRHAHVSREDLNILFGENYQLTKFKDLIQPGEFAANEIITMAGPTGAVLPVRILGPVRSVTQVEISRSDSFALKIKNVPVRESGHIDGTPGCVLIGPQGAVTLKQGVIAAMRHIHFTPEDASYFGVKDKDLLRVKLDTPKRPLVFEKVLARVKDTYALEMHIDVDEANAADAGQMTPAFIIKD